MSDHISDGLPRPLSPTDSGRRPSQIRCDYLEEHHKISPHTRSVSHFFTSQVVHPLCSTRTPVTLRPKRKQVMLLLHSQTTKAGARYPSFVKP